MTVNSTQATPLPPPPAAASRSLGGVGVRNTGKLMTPDTMLCLMVYAPAKFGKTTFASSLDRMTKRFMGKPSLVIGVEVGEGGGAMSIQDAQVDFVTPTTYDEYTKILGALQTDKHYGGVILDSSTEYVNRFLKPFALKFPSRENVATRSAGVPERSDYQTMGEKARTDFTELIRLTVNPNKDIRKHIIVTALQKEKTTPQGEVVSIYPDLPGAMSGASVAMFNTVGYIIIRQRNDKDPSSGKVIRVSDRFLVTQGDGVRVAGDRTKAFPPEAPLDMEVLWERYWLPRIEAVNREEG
jgi:hypothetical protein